MYIGIDGESLCGDCYYEKYSFCQECGETQYADDIHYINDKYLCTSCYEDEVYTCDECGEMMEDIDDTFIGINGECLCEEHFLDKYNTCEECGETILIEDLEDSSCPDCIKKKKAACEVKGERDD